MDDGRVEVGSLMERRNDDRGRQGRRALCIAVMVSLSRVYFHMVWDLGIWNWSWREFGDRWLGTGAGAELLSLYQLGSFQLTPAYHANRILACIFWVQCAAVMGESRS